MRLRHSLVLAATLLAGCADRTALIVVVSSTDLAVGTDVDTLHFDVISASGHTATQDYRIASGWPESLAIRPAVGEGAEVVTVNVLGLLGDRVVGRASKTTMFEQGQTVTVEVTLVRCTTDCGALADMGVRDGAPPDVPMPMDGGPELGPRDLGPVDGDTDLGPTDLGPPDLGAMDLGPPDLGMAGSCATGGCATHVVISELATGGPGGATDEFVELYNPTSAAIDVSSLQVQYLSAAGTGSWTTKATLPGGTMLPSHAFYLVGSATYGGAPAADPGGGWSSGFAAAGGHVRLLQGAAEVDRVAWGTAAMPEGVAIAASGSDTMRSFERKAFSTSDLASMTAGLDATHGNSIDTDMNASDFVTRALREPQSSASAVETP